MRTAYTVFSSIVKKTAAAFLLSALAIFYHVFKLLLVIYRLLSSIVGLAGIILVPVDIYKNGLNFENGNAMLFVISIIALRYLLPLLVPVMEQWTESLKAYIAEPIHHRSPVRYTI